MPTNITHPDPVKFSEILKHHRIVRSLTQVELSERSGVSIYPIQTAESRKKSAMRPNSVLRSLAHSSASDPFLPRADGSPKKLTPFQCAPVTFWAMAVSER